MADILIQISVLAVDPDRHSEGVAVDCIGATELKRDYLWFNDIEIAGDAYKRLGKLLADMGSRDS